MFILRITNFIKNYTLLIKLKYNYKFFFILRIKVFVARRFLIYAFKPLLKPHL